MAPTLGKRAQSGPSIELEHLGLTPSHDPLTPMGSDDWFQYPGYFRRPAHCKLDVFGREGQDFRVFIVTELDNNDGTSVTNAAETVWSEICHAYNVEPGKNTVMIEHYPATKSFAESFSLVVFKSQQLLKREGRWEFKNVGWFPLNREEVNRLLGREF